MAVRPTASIKQETVVPVRRLVRSSGTHADLGQLGLQHPVVASLTPRNAASIARHGTVQAIENCQRHLICRRNVRLLECTAAGAEVCDIAEAVTEKHNVETGSRLVVNLASIIASGYAQAEVSSCQTYAHALLSDALLVVLVHLDASHVHLVAPHNPVSNDVGMHLPGPATIVAVGPINQQLLRTLWKLPNGSRLRNGSRLWKLRNPLSNSGLKLAHKAPIDGSKAGAIWNMGVWEECCCHLLAIPDGGWLRIVLIAASGGWLRVVIVIRHPSSDEAAVN